MKSKPISQREYVALAGFRHALRVFQRFSEEAARAAGVTPAQHQLLLAIKGWPEDESPSVSDIADRLQLRTHSTVELVQRAEQAGLVTTQADAGDHRRQLLAVTTAGEQLLESLSNLHRDELRRFRAEMNDILGGARLINSQPMSVARRWLGVELDEVSPLEKFVSAVGGALAILAVLTICDLFVQGGSLLLVASMGASAVLLFAVPHGQMSQPWPVLVGHVASAAIGVTCAAIFGPTHLAAALAVGLTIATMHLCKSIHPPGGATALTAVLGGPAIVDMGFRFVMVPVALNAALMVLIAIAFNGLFAWRRYPTGLAAFEQADPSTAFIDEPAHQAVLEALRAVDSFIDITEADLIHLHRMITGMEQENEGVRRNGRTATGAASKRP